MRFNAFCIMVRSRPNHNVVESVVDQEYIIPVCFSSSSSSLSLSNIISVRTSLHILRFVFLLCAYYWNDSMFIWMFTQIHWLRAFKYIRTDILNIGQARITANDDGRYGYVWLFWHLYPTFEFFVFLFFYLSLNCTSNWFLI